MLFSQIILPSPSPTESKRLFYISVSLLLSRLQGPSSLLMPIKIMERLTDLHVTLVQGPC